GCAMRTVIVLVMLGLPPAACGSIGERTGVLAAADAAADEGDGARPKRVLFSSAKDPRPEAEPIRNDAGMIVPADVCCDSQTGSAGGLSGPAGVCCDSQTGCFSSPERGLCRMVGKPYTPVDIGNSVRFWIPQAMGGISLTVETEEPADGFTGACLLGPDGRAA